MIKRIQIFYYEFKNLSVWLNKVKKIHNDVLFNFQVEIWKSEVAKRLPMLEKLDGELIIRTEENETLLQLDSPVQI